MNSFGLCVIDLEKSPELKKFQSRSNYAGTLTLQAPGYSVKLKILCFDTMIAAVAMNRDFKLFTLNT